MSYAMMNVVFTVILIILSLYVLYTFCTLLIAIGSLIAYTLKFLFPKRYKLNKHVSYRSNSHN